MFSGLLSFFIDCLFSLLQFLVFVFEVQKSASKPCNLIFTCLFTPQVFVLAYISQKRLVLLKVCKLFLPLQIFEILLINVRSQAFNVLLIIGGKLLVFFQILLLSFPFVAVAHKALVIFMNNLDHGILLLDELFLLFIKLLSFLNNFFFLLRETVIDFTLLSFLLQQSHSLQRSL